MSDHQSLRKNNEECQNSATVISAWSQARVKGGGFCRGTPPAGKTQVLGSSSTGAGPGG